MTMAMAEAVNSLKIELDNYSGFYFPGQTVTGRVVRIVTKPEEQIKVLQIKFQGWAKVIWQTTQTHVHTHAHEPSESHGIEQTHRYTTDSTSRNHMVTTTIVHRNEEPYFSQVIQLNKQPSDGTPITSLPIGRHSFPFKFVLPVEIPASYNDANPNAPCRIFYEAEATFRSRGIWKSEVRAVKTLSVRRPIDLNMFPTAAKSCVIKDEKYLCCLCCARGPISFKLTFNKTGFTLGEKINFLAEFVNHSNTEIRRAHVWISRTVFFRATDETVRYEIREEQLGGKLSVSALFTGGGDAMAAVPLSLMIPTHRQINSYGCKFMESIYQLHIEVIIPRGINLKGTLPIVIGVVPFVIQEGDYSQTTIERRKSRSRSRSRSVQQET